MKNITRFEKLLRCFRKPFIQTITHSKDGIIVMSADNPNRHKNRTKIITITK